MVRVMQRWARSLLAAMAVTVLVSGAGCSDDDTSGDEPVDAEPGTSTSTRPPGTSAAATTPTTTAKASSTTTTTSSSSSTSSSTSSSSTTSSTATPSLSPGADCALGSDPDCIDPDGDGQGTYLIGGADCIAALPGSPELCADLDGDGVAGYPDSG